MKSVFAGLAGGFSTYAFVFFAAGFTKDAVFAVYMSTIFISVIICVCAGWIVETLNNQRK